MSDLLTLRSKKRQATNNVRSESNALEKTDVRPAGVRLSFSSNVVGQLHSLSGVCRCKLQEFIACESSAKFRKIHGYQG